MKKLINAFIIIGICGLLACHSKTTEKQEPVKQNPAPKQPVAEQKQDNHHEHVDQMAFVEYLDDGDYFQILARKGDSTFCFINETDNNRDLNRGDQIQVIWKKGTVTVPGDNDSEMPALLLLSVKKLGDGPVTSFRNTYGKKLKYTWSTDEEFTTSYLNKVYQLTEYYLTQTKNPLLQAAIKKRDQLTYSIESAERNGQQYRVIGIAPVGPNGSTIVQWLYVGEEDGRIYEYDLPQDKLIAFD
ncbi:hypothetical protein [Pedobacter sp. KLB.chiD]|uniref:hypothetical protein n=1 Tax=Pedobacter sp. KLB.chiD TaxID=3387402 RepID=UPI00399960D2